MLKGGVDIFFNIIINNIIYLLKKNIFFFIDNDLVK